jgi:protein gp37
VSANTEIGWTDHTWPVVRGCSKVSDGCKFCWAIRDAHLHGGNKNPKMQEHFGGLTVIENGRPNWTGVVRLDESILEWPLHWRKPARIFAASSGDLYHEELPRVEIATVYAIMAYCQHHTFQILTKRPEVRFRYCGLGEDVRDLLQSLLEQHGPPPHAKPFRWPLPNVWEGVSVEDQATADERVPLLLQTPAALRFMSYEPALGPL